MLITAFKWSSKLKVDRNKGQRQYKRRKETAIKPRGSLFYRTEQIQLYKNKIGHYEKKPNTLLQTPRQIREISDAKGRRGVKKEYIT